VETLQGSWQFNRVYERGKKIVSDNVIVFYLCDEAITKGTQFGFVASKKVGNAVKRNRAKRLMREAARSLEHYIACEDLWIVLVARRGIPALSSEEVEKDLRRKLTEAGLIK